MYSVACCTVNAAENAGVYESMPPLFVTQCVIRRHCKCRTMDVEWAVVSNDWNDWNDWTDITYLNVITKALCWVKEGRVSAMNSELIWLLNAYQPRMIICKNVLPMVEVNSASKYIRGGMNARLNEGTYVSGWYDAPSYMQLLDANHRVVIRDCGSGGDCLFSSIVYALNEKNIYDENNIANILDNNNIISYSNKKKIKV